MSYQFAHQPQTFKTQSSFGLSPKTAAILCYIWAPVTSIIVLATEKHNRMVRFHAWQSVFFGLSIVALTMVLSVVMGIAMLASGAVSPYLGILVSVISLLIWALVATVILGFWLLCVIRAYRGRMYKLPLIGKYAEKMINK